MANKKRAATGNKNGSKLYPERLKRGEANGNAKLTQKIVNEIRSKYVPRKMGCVKLSRLYNISRATVLQIVNYKTWRQHT